MGKWSEIVKTLPKHEEPTNPWRAKVAGLKDQARALGALDTEPGQLPKGVHALRALRAQKEALEAQLKDKNAEVAAAEELIGDHYLAIGREVPYTFEDGARVEVSEQPTFALEDPEALMTWIKEQKLEGLLTLNAQTRDSLAKQLLEAGKALPGGLVASKYTQVRFVGPRKPKGQASGA